MLKARSFVGFSLAWLVYLAPASVLWAGLLMLLVIVR